MGSDLSFKKVKPWLYEGPFGWQLKRNGSAGKWTVVRPDGLYIGRRPKFEDALAFAILKMVSGGYESWEKPRDGEGEDFERR